MMDPLDVVVTHGAGLDIHKKVIVASGFTPTLAETRSFAADGSVAGAGGLANRLWRDARGDGGHRGVLEAGGECAGVV